MADQIIDVNNRLISAHLLAKMQGRNIGPFDDDFYRMCYTASYVKISAMDTSKYCSLGKVEQVESFWCEVLQASLAHKRILGKVSNNLLLSDKHGIERSMVIEFDMAYVLAILTEEENLGTLN